MRNTYTKLGILLLSILISFTTFAQYNNAFKFKITGNNYSDETVIRMLNGASQNFDAMYDASKLFSSNPNVPSIYTNDITGQKLSINALPEFIEDMSITIYTNIPVAGTYTINFEEIYALTSNYKISLSNTSANSHYRLLGDTALTFTFNPQQNSPSFTFNISTPLVYSNINETCFGMNDGSLTINNPGNTDWVAEILDANNSVISSNFFINDSNCFENLQPGTYSVLVNSKGIIDEFFFDITPALNIVADFNMDSDTIFLSEGGEVNFTNNSQYAQTYSWGFGDGGSSNNNDPTYIYTAAGNYDITLSALNSNCISDTTKIITVLQSPDITTSIFALKTNERELTNLGNSNYQLTSPNNLNKRIMLYDINGSLVFEDSSTDDIYTLSLTQYQSGLYILNVMDMDGSIFNQKLYR